MPPRMFILIEHSGPQTEQASGALGGFAEAQNAVARASHAAGWEGGGDESSAFPEGSQWVLLLLVQGATLRTSGLRGCPTSASAKPREADPLYRWLSESLNETSFPMTMDVVSTGTHGNRTQK